MKLSTFLVASLLLVAVAASFANAAPAPTPVCTIGDGVCAQKLFNTRSGRWLVPSKPETGYGLIIEEEQISDSCAIQAGITTKPTNTRYVFDFEYAAGTSVYATMDEASGTLTVSGVVSGGPVRDYYGAPGYDGSKVACAADNGLYKLEYTATGFVKQADGSYKMELPYHLVGGVKVANGAGTVSKIGGGPSFVLGIQDHPVELYAFLFNQVASPRHLGRAWVDTIGAGGPGSKTGHSRDFIFEVSTTCTCPPPDPSTDCETGDGKCAQTLYNNRNGKWLVASNPDTAYAFIVEDEQISDACATQAGIPLNAKPVNTRYVFDFNHHMGTGVTAVIDAAAGTLTISGTVWGGPVIGHYDDVGYTGDKFACSADVGLYKLTYVATHMVKQADGSFKMVLPYHYDDEVSVLVTGTKIANGAGVVSKIGGGPSFDLGIQNHPGHGYSFWFGVAGSPRKSGIAWVDTIGPGGPGSKTGKSRDFNFEIGVDCNCDPTDPSSECETLVADEDCQHVQAHSDGTCVCVTFSADGALITVPCA